MANYNIDPNFMIKQQKILNNTQVQNQKQNQKVNQNLGPSFQDVLSKVGQQELKFSKHAVERLKSRNIELSTNDIELINKAVDKASAKGVKEALIIMDNKAFIANVKNKTIITAAVEDQLQENVFTKIDGAVII